MSKASPARRYRKLIERKRLCSSAVASVSPKDPKPDISSRVQSGSEAVKPAVLGVSLFVSVAMGLALPYAKEPGGAAACNNSNGGDVP